MQLVFKISNLCATDLPTLDGQTDRRTCNRNTLWSSNHNKLRLCYI